MSHPPTPAHDAPAGTPPLALRLAAQLAHLPADLIDASTTAKVNTCLYDFIGCAFEARDKAWSRQALSYIQTQHASHTPQAGHADIIATPCAAQYADAAFVNGVMGHGLVREDMHSASISHMGVVVLPVLLALSQYRRVSGRALLLAAVAGYEVGGKLGGALMDARIARIHRPTGIVGPLAAAAAGACLLGLNETQTANAIALAANTVSGFNQWAHTGGSEMYFHIGFAAANSLKAVLLAQAGAFASPSALDGEAGLFAAHGKRAAADHVQLFSGSPEIMAVYHKPVPACNFAQTATQAALALARTGACAAEQIRAISIRVPAAGAAYPGCDYSGPYAHALQAKMSIQYNVVSALLSGSLSEANFDTLDDARMQRLLALTQLVVDDEMTQAYPGQQGGEVAVTLADGSRHAKRLSNVVNASAEEVRQRFNVAVQAVAGDSVAAAIKALIEQLDSSADAGLLAASLSLKKA